MIPSDPGTLVQFVGLLVVAGAIGGLMAGLLGVGGGMIIVPILYHLFTILEIDPAQRMHLAVGTSLATIVVTSVVSARAHARRGSIDWSIVRSWAPWLFAGVVVGSALAGVLDASGLKLVFGTTAILVAIYMAFGRQDLTLRPSPPEGPLKAGVAGLIGTLSTLIGIGGGTFTVPTLMLCSVAPKVAVGTAAAAGLVIALPGAAGFLWLGLGQSGLPPLSVGYVNLAAFVVLIPMTSFFAPIGARIAHSISALALRRAFAAFLLVNGTAILS